MSDQKYRQRGYQDHDRSDREKSGGGGPAGPGRRRGRNASRGRAAAAWACRPLRFSAAVPAAPRPRWRRCFPGAICGKCRGDLHTCKNCRHFDSALNNECRQAVPLRIAVKTKGNTCPLFEARLAQEQEQEVAGHRDARSAFDALFQF